MVHSRPISAPDAVHTVTLFIPALFWPHAGAAHDAPTAPRLQVLLGRAQRTAVICEDEQAWLCEQFGVTRQADWPFAPIALLGTGADPAGQFWLSADPVHFRVNRGQLILLPPEALAITQAEAVALCAALNHHFATDGFTFSAPDPLRWYVKPPRPARLRTTSLSRAAGQDVDRLLPEGEDGLAWHRILNEAQMVLHAHPVNEDRSQRGALPINSVWFSGGGILPRARTDFQAMIGSGPLTRGLARLANIPFAEADQGIVAISADNVLVDLSGPAAAAMHMDPVAWRHAVEILEQRWFVPLARMLRKRFIRRIIIATVHDGHSYRWSISPMNLTWRWWRSAASLASPTRAQ